MTRSVIAPSRRNQQRAYRVDTVDGMKARWEFLRYAEREHRASGWLQYVGLGPVLLVIGFHKGKLYRQRRSGTWKSKRPYVWIELTLYAWHRHYSVHPMVRIPEAWLS